MTRLSERTLAWVAGVSLCVAAILSVCGWWLQPDEPWRYVLPPCVLAGLWVLVESAWHASASRGRDASTILKWHRLVFAVVAAFLAARLALRIGVMQGAIGLDTVPSLRRSSGVIAGGLWFLWGNYLPKLLSPWTPEEEPFDWQAVHRFVGRVAALGGLAGAVVWLTFPLPAADVVSDGIVIAVCVLALGRKFYSAATRPRRPPSSSVYSSS
jgi:hypothetical protein